MDFGYECPHCGTVGGHNRRHFGPEGDGRNLERECGECGLEFIADRDKFVDQDSAEVTQDEQVFCPGCGNSTDQKVFCSSCQLELDRQGVDVYP